MSGALLAWGIDLGHEDSVAAKLFDNVKWYREGKDEWDIFCYGPEDKRLALLLNRTTVSKDSKYTDDYGVTGFIEVVLGGSGFPELKSQPTSDEIEELKEIVKQVRPDPAVAEMVLQLLLLPLD